MSVVASKPSAGNLNAFLKDIHKRFIEPNREDLHKQKVVAKVLKQLQDQMRAVDEYYNQHYREITGNDYDIKKLEKSDELRVRFVIDTASSSDCETISVLPISHDKWSGCVKIYTNNFQQGYHTTKDLNKTVYLWHNTYSNSLCRTKFLEWFERIVGKALKGFKVLHDLPVCVIDGVTYKIRLPIAWKRTMFVQSEQFRFKITLLPVLLFSDFLWIDRKGYRAIPAGCCRDYFMVDPYGEGNVVPSDCFGILSMHDQEEQMLNNTPYLRQSIQLIQLFSNAPGMNIKNYWIKTVALWEINYKKNTDPSFWARNDLATTFKYILLKFYEALDRGSFPYFWNNKTNVVGQLDIIDKDKYKIIDLLYVLQDDSNQNISVLRYLLTPEKYRHETL